MDNYLSATTKLTPYEELLSTFYDCPVCLSTMFPPIYRCNAGHSICKNCHQRVTSCPRCRLPRINRRAPRPLETIGLLLRFHCKYEMDGCEFIGQAQSLTTHYKTCKFKPITCPAGSMRFCSWSDSERHLARHLLQQHSDRTKSGESYAFQTVLQRRQLPNKPIFMYAFDKVFLTYWKLNVARNEYKFVVEIVEQAVSELFMYKLELVPCKDYIPTRTYLQFCSQWKREESSVGVNVHYSILSEYVNDRKKLCYKVIIEKERYKDSW